MGTGTDTVTSRADDDTQRWGGRSTRRRNIDDASGKRRPAAKTPIVTPGTSPSSAGIRADRTSQARNFWDDSGVRTRPIVEGDLEHVGRRTQCVEAVADALHRDGPAGQPAEGDRP